MKLLRSLLLCLFFFTGKTFAIDLPWIHNPEQPHARVRLLLSGEVNTGKNEVIAGLQVQLDSPWKTYWRSPGDAGIAPTITWKPDVNLTDTQWLWPVPERFEILGMHTFGYQGDVVFPLILNVKDLNAPVNLNGTLRLSSCTTICVLNDYEINQSFIPAELATNSEAAFLIDRALSSVPVDSPDPGLSINSVYWDSASGRVEVSLTTTGSWQQPDVILDGIDETVFGLPTIYQDDKQLKAYFSASSWLGAVDLSGQAVTVTAINGSDSREASVEVTEKRIASPSILPETSFLVMLGFAFLGGLILNLMPCVLPVLGLKLSSVIQASGQSRLLTRLQFLSSAAGILFSFWLLAGLLFVLKWTGSSIGWGIQFQNPWFIGIMTLVTALFAANLLDAFAIQLPSRLSTVLATSGDNSVGGHFIQGMFATLLATPCSAPFLGTAVAFALSTSNLNLLVMFTAIGVGMATPYLLIALRPALLGWLPGPGPWMINLRRILSVLLMVTTFWLISLLQGHIISVAFILLVLSTAGIFSYLLLKVLFPFSKPRTAALSTGIAAVVALGWTGFSEQNQSPVDKSGLEWQAFDANAIERYVSEGKTVFVDITADWCVTCKANKIRVLDREPVYSALQSDHIVVMRGDWTHPSAGIDAYLKRNERFGVPFNKVYGPEAPQGLPLPVILDADTVLHALDRSQTN